MTALSAFQFDGLRQSAVAEQLLLVGTEGDEAALPLADLMQDVGAQLAADGSMVSWQDDGGSLVRLYADGACVTDASVELAMLAATASLRTIVEPAALRWATSDEAGAGNPILTIRLPYASGTVIATLVFVRTNQSITDAARVTAARLFPVLRAFFGIWSMRGRAMARIRGLTAAMNSSDIGTILVDRRGSIVFANTSAETLIAEGDGLRRSGTMLASTRLADTMRLQAAIEHVVSGAEPAPAQLAAPVISLKRRDRRPLLAAVIGTDAPSTADEEVAAMVHVFDPSHNLASRITPVCKLYGLSPTEARLATLLAGGAALANAATSMRIQEQTARSYLKQVFAKTATNRQGELVWLMLTSAVRTAPAFNPNFC